MGRLQFTLRELFIVVTFSCVAMGMFWAGRRRGMQAGWDEARDHQRVMLHLHAKKDHLWSRLRLLAADDDGIFIIGSKPCELHGNQHRDYMNYWRADNE